jgi:phospholipid/cholesterol/gamma-HCH transport system substrate-binding protein
MKVVTMALRQYWWAVAVIIGAMILAIAVAGVLLVNQRFPLPWVDTYTVKAEFSSAQAVTPGQGQQVTVAGVQVGEISTVKLRDGRAVVSLSIKKEKLARVHRDATLALRPRTGLQDMTIELDPGRTSSPVLPDGGTLNATRTTRQVQFDEVLASLDSDTRAYLQQFLSATDRGLSDNTAQTRRVLRLGTPTAKQADRVLQVLADRRRSVSRVVSSLGSVAERLQDHNASVAATVRRAADTLKTVGGRDAEVRSSLQQLPGTLAQVDSTLTATASLAKELRPAAVALRPAVKDVRAALPDLDPLLRAVPAGIEPVARLGKVTRKSTEDLRTTLSTLRPQLSNVSRLSKSLQWTTNVLGYEPPGDEQGNLFWFSWFWHNANSVLANEDAHGVAWRGQAIFSCTSFTGLDALRPVIDLLNTARVCQ